MATEVHALQGSKLARSARVLAASWRLAWSHRPLRRMALIAALAWLALSLLFLAAFGAAVGATDSWWSGLVVSFGAVYPLTFAGVFFGVALVAVANEVLDGRSVSSAFGVRVARARLREIAGWALLATGVWFLLEHVVRRIPGAGRAAHWALSAGWAVVTLFVVPILALEGCGPRECLRRSARVLRERWGEGAIGALSIWAVLTILVVPACAAFGAGAGGLAQGSDSANTWALFSSGALSLSLIGVAGLLMRELFALALYRYATQGARIGTFTASDLEAALKPARRGIVARLAGAGKDWARDALAAVERARRWLWLLLAVHVALLVGGMVTFPEGSPPGEASAGVRITEALIAATTVALLAFALRALWRVRRRPAPKSGLRVVALGSAMAIAGLGWYAANELRRIDEPTYLALYLPGVLLVLAGLALASFAAWVRDRKGGMRVPREH